MTDDPIARPAPGEYDPYFDRYIALVADGDVVALLETQVEETLALLRGCAEADGTFRYAQGKWSLTEVVGHLADTERVFGYRALRFSRNDRTPLPGFEQDDFVAHGEFGSRTLGSVVAEFAAVRAGTVALVRGFTSEQLTRRGVANEVEMSVRAVPFILAGHERHHVQVIQDRYLSRS
jgi:hypothetical protein